MNGKILTTEEGIKIANQLQSKNLKIVLVGGCFDILHIGHLTFLEEAKKQGDSLFVLVESDEHIKQLKGAQRPLNTQSDRAKLLSHLDIIDYVIILPPTTDYDYLMQQIKPAIIATTAGDSNRMHKERQAKQIGAKVVDVTSEISNQSTTRLINVLNEL
ncbi:adenylyltransferase/cytidyltransferase family protein [Candidatus Roizmanbacteria bacterium]|nr:adenylyltransferase/cytidyltransferase family protein [Candidatus Roizmanbacteria bacterium]